MSSIINLSITDLVARVKDRNGDLSSIWPVRGPGQAGGGGSLHRGLAVVEGWQGSVALWQPGPATCGSHGPRLTAGGGSFRGPRIVRRVPGSGGGPQMMPRRPANDATAD
jgi:hypothetical protein